MGVSRRTSGMVEIEFNYASRYFEVTRRFCYSDVTRPPDRPTAKEHIYSPLIPILLAIHGTTKAGLTT